VSFYRKLRGKEQEMPGTTMNRLGPRSGDPETSECLRCYLRRTLEEHGCDGSRTWSVRWCKLRAPLEDGLLTRLENLGGYCDCEILLNTWQEDIYDGGRPARCSGTTHEDPLVPCRIWSPHPESLIRNRDEDDEDDEDDAYRSYGEQGDW
jgi:hypothetical protein